nr:hypothetical protein [uncultured Caldimonas sp.]
MTMASIARVGRLAAAWAAAALVLGCGGGGGASSSSTGADAGPPQAAASTPQPITSLRIESTADQAHRDVPFTLGQVFVPGDLQPGQGLVLLQGDRTLPLQLDVKATHADGSVRHAAVSGVLPALAARESLAMQLARVSSPVQGAQAAARPDVAASVQIDVDGQRYTASAADGTARTTWLQGPLATEWLAAVPLEDAQGNPHPHLMVRFGMRAYAGGASRVDVIVENNWAYETGPRNFTYDVEVRVGGEVVHSATAFTHYHHARWRKTFWVGDEPQLHIAHDSAYLMRTQAVPNFDPAAQPTEAALAALANSWANAQTQPMAPGIVTTAMPMTGGRADIGPLPQWAALYLLSQDARAKRATLGVGDLAGSWPIHLRDKATGLPVSLADYPYMTLLGRPGDTVNPRTRKSEAFPTCGGVCTTAPHNYQPDSSHQPSLAYVPYLVTADHYYLEELHFWANYNMVAANPYYRGFEQGLLKWDQVRGQAWSLRTLGHAAYITPDVHPLKSYFVERVGHNIDWYNATYAVGQPNALGVIDGTGQYAFRSIVYNTPVGAQTGLAPWQDDFFTWSVGHLAELGFDDALPMLRWKARFPVGRMTDPAFCWIDGAVYALAVRPASNAPLYTSLAQAYQATMQGTGTDGTAVPLVNSTGARYLDQPCGSQAQADWRTQLDRDQGARRGPWVAGEMTGYASSIAGFPSNMQPALAVAATSGVPNARQAWEQFMARSVKPDYRTAPQWAVVPRTR